MQRAFPDAGLQSKLPALDGFAAMATPEVIDAMVAVQRVMERLIADEADSR